MTKPESSWNDLHGIARRPAIAAVYERRGWFRPCRECGVRCESDGSPKRPLCGNCRREMR